MVVVLGIGSSNQAPTWLQAELRGVWALRDLAGIWLDARRQHNFLLIFLSPNPLDCGRIAADTPRDGDQENRGAGGRAPHRRLHAASGDKPARYSK